jgi:hypothetical protein
MLSVGFSIMTPANVLRGGRDENSSDSLISNSINDQPFE